MLGPFYVSQFMTVKNINFFLGKYILVTTMAEDKVETKDGAGSSDLANSFKTDNVFLFVPNLIGYSRVVLALLSFWFMPSNCYAAGFCYLVTKFYSSYSYHSITTLFMSSNQIINFRLHSS